MSKEVSKSALDKLFGGASTTKDKVLKPIKATEPDVHTVRPANGKTERVRYCSEINKELYAKVRTISQDNNWSIRSIFECSLETFIEAYEKKFGPVKPRVSSEGDVHDVFS